MKISIKSNLSLLLYVPLSFALYTWISLSFVEARSIGDECILSGGLWNECASSCTSQCINESGELITRTSDLCTQECVLRCECPIGLAFDGLQCTDPNGIVPICQFTAHDDHQESFNHRTDREDSTQEGDEENNSIDYEMPYTESSYSEDYNGYEEDEVVLTDEFVIALWQTSRSTEAYQNLEKICTLHHYQSQECQDAWAVFATIVCAEIEEAQDVCEQIWINQIKEYQETIWYEEYGDYLGRGISNESQCIELGGYMACERTSNSINDRCRWSCHCDSSHLMTVQGTCRSIYKPHHTSSFDSSLDHWEPGGCVVGGETRAFNHLLILTLLMGIIVHTRRFKKLLQIPK